MMDDTLRTFAIRETMVEFGVTEEVAARAVDAVLARAGLPPDLREPADGKVVPIRRNTWAGEN